MANTSTSLMVLPPEIRLEIFRNLLLTRRANRTAPGEPQNRHDLQPAILRTCTKIHDEAKEVLYRENIFIRIINNMSNFKEQLNHAGICTLTHPSRPLVFQQHSLDVWINLDFGPMVASTVTEICSEDLPTLCNELWSHTIMGPKVKSIFLQVTPSILDLARPRRSPDSLVAPFKALWQVPFMEIASTIRTDFKGEVDAVREVMHSMSAHDLISSMQSVRGTADQRTGEGKPHEAIALCSQAIEVWTRLIQNPEVRCGRPDTRRFLDPKCLWAKSAVEYFHTHHSLSFAFWKLGKSHNARFHVWKALECSKIKVALPALPIPDSDITLARTREATWDEALIRAARRRGDVSSTLS